MNKKIGVIMASLALLAVIIPAAGCSQSGPTTSSSINLQDMRSDIDALQSSFVSLNSAFNALSQQISQGSTSGIIRSEFTALQNDFNALKAQVDGLVVPEDYATQDDLDDLESQLDSINSSLSALSAQVTALNTELTAVKQDVAVLKTQVATLQATTATTTTPPTTTTTVTPTPQNSLDISVRPVSGSSMFLVDGSNTTTAQTFLVILQVKNNAAVSFQNVQVMLPLYSNIAYTDVKAINLVTLSGGTLYWQYAGGYAASGFPFISAPFTVAPLSNTTYTLQVSLTLKNTVADGAYLYPIVIW
jgi:predicted  nucleic acid-binding Zn-ribbon protein